MNNKIVYDLETKKTFAEVGGLQSNHHLLGISFIGVYSYSQNKYFGFLEKDIPLFEKILLTEKSQIIGFNSKGFDNLVLQPYLKKLQISELPQLDILEEIKNKLGFRIKLESTAQATLGEGKSGTGLDAIKYYREKDFDSLAKYCMDDVRITKEIYEYGRNHGCLYYMAGGEKRPIPIPWSDAPTISEIIIEAFQVHRRLQIQYFSVDDKQNKEIYEDEIDILKLNKDKIEVYCQKKNRKKELIISQIIKVKATDEIYAHQATLI
ncbi:MAG: ribonuclease H-like domain-containing protein [Patescibacteria group bacterium]